MPFYDAISEASIYVVELLANADTKIVFAESCTAGLIGASLGAVPGVSQHLCGSAVVYREATKQQWLGVTEETLRASGAVSAGATSEITAGVLRNTPEAEWAMGITGHFGPDCPPEDDGQVYVACCRREGDSIRELCAQDHRLNSISRADRQQESVVFSLHFFVECFERNNR